MLQKLSTKCSVKMVFLKNFAKFTGKHLCWSPFSIKLWVLTPAQAFSVNSATFSRITRVAASDNSSSNHFLTFIHVNVRKTKPHYIFFWDFLKSRRYSFFEAKYYEFIHIYNKLVIMLSPLYLIQVQHRNLWIELLLQMMLKQLYLIR